MIATVSAFCPRCGVANAEGREHTFAGLGGELCSGEPWHAFVPSHEYEHDAARNCAEEFAKLDYIGQMESECPVTGRPTVLLLGNCNIGPDGGCHSTICRVVPAGSAEALTYAKRGRVAA